jgi:hypothetical protein
VDALRHGTWPAQQLLTSSIVRAKRHACALPSAQTLDLMKVTWKDLSFLPSDAALAALYDSWSWLLPSGIRPVIVSTLGDVFFQTEGPEVFLLNTGSGEVENVAASRDEFMGLLKTDKATDWFMPYLIEQLITAGKVLKPDQCYTYVTLPIFKEGKRAGSGFSDTR